MNFTKDAISGQEGFDWLQRILEIDPEAVVVFITAYGDAEKAVKAIKAGATDFVLKPWQNEKLIATVSASVQLNGHA
jgi:two-component system, NtrC family, response regulator HydG